MRCAPCTTDNTDQTERAGTADPQSDSAASVAHDSAGCENRGKAMILRDCTCPCGRVEKPTNGYLTPDQTDQTDQNDQDDSADQADQSHQSGQSNAAHHDDTTQEEA